MALLTLRASTNYKGSDMKKEYLAAVPAPEGLEGENVIEIQGLACLVFEFETEEAREGFIQDVYEQKGIEAVRVGVVATD